jgi:D-alanyl-D-alanine carboxypeptidase
VLVAVSRSFAQASPARSEINSLEKELNNDLVDYLSARTSIEHISTLSLTVSFRGDPRTIKMAVGTTQYGAGQEVKPSNLFQIGSNTKAFTSVLILQLEAAGVLSINDTLGEWLPEYPAWSSINIRQLLNMTSGIPTYDLTSAQITEYENNPYIESTPAQLVAYVYPKTDFAPGTGWEYSNTGYILMQMIIEKASQSHSYEAELDRLIAATKANMRRGCEQDPTSSDDSRRMCRGLRSTLYEPYFYRETIADRLVSGYYVNTDPPALTKLLGDDTSRFSLGWAQAAGGMLSTPQDLTTWVRALFEGDVLPAQQKSELESLVSTQDGQAIEQTSDSNPQAFGLGIFQATLPTLGLFWGYQGSTIGYRATYAYFPTSGLIICVFTNSQAPKANDQLATGLIPTLYGTLQKFGKSGHQH